MTDILIQLSEDEQAVLSKYASLENRAQEDLAKEILSATLRKLALRDASIEASGAAIDKAFSLLDAAEVPQMGMAAQTIVHPCARFSTEPPIRYTGQCSGSCQLGQGESGLSVKPCYFGREAARQCQDFRPRSTHLR